MQEKTQGPRILGIIPARAGSKGVPGKNMREVCGKTLIQWALDAASQVTLIDRLIVSSDDERILSVAQQISDELPVRRPAELADDESTAVEYVEHALDYCETHFGETFDIVVIIQVTSPLTLPEDIDGTIRKLLEHRAPSAASVVRIPVDVHPIKMKKLQDQVLVPAVEDEKGRMATHHFGDIYVRNGSVYASRTEVFRGGQVLGEPCLGYVMPRERSVDINEEFDMVYAEFLMQRSEALKA